MKKAIGLILVSLLFQCESGDLYPELKFSGVIEKGDFFPAVPASEVKVRITYYGGEDMNYISMDSTVTDFSGKYSF